MRKYWVIGGGVGAALLGFLLLSSVWSGEPRAHGKSLSYWLDELTPLPRTGTYSWLVLNPTEGQTDEKFRRARAAIRSMGPKAVPFLLEQVRRRHSLGERVYAVAWPWIPQGLRRSFPPPRTFQNYGSPHSKIVSALQALDRNAVPALIAGLSNSNNDVQITTLAALGGFGADAASALPALTRLAKSPNGFVRRWSILTLGRIGPAWTNASQTLFAALKDDDRSPLPGSTARVRETAAEVLGQMGPQARMASPELRRLLIDTDPGVRQEAAIALWRINGDPSVLPILAAELKKSDSCKKLLAVLGEMGPAARSAIPAIREALGHSWPRVVELSHQRFASGDRGKVGSTLEEVAGDALFKIDSAVAEELSGTSFHVAPLSVAGGSGTVHIGGQYAVWEKMGQAAVPTLVQVLDNSNPATRIEALLALSRLGWKPERETIPKLARLLEDRETFRYRGLDDEIFGREFVCIGDLAAERLSLAGADARSTLPALRAMLVDPYWASRFFAGDTTQVVASASRLGMPIDPPASPL